MNAKPFTTTLSLQMHRFLKQEAAQRKTSCRTIIEEALQQYRKAQLAKEINEGFTLDRIEEGQKIAAEFRWAQTQLMQNLAENE